MNTAVPELAAQLPVPAGLAYLPYQVEGIEYALARPRTLIADEMGLGKTVQALGVINALDCRHVLIVCPASLRLNWAREARKWLVRRRAIRVIDERNTPLVGAEIVICNYDRLWDYWDRLAAERWDLLIADEAHYLKNPKSQRAKALFGGLILAPPGGKHKRTRKRGIVASVARLLLLTGTPILNKPIELYPLLKALDYNRWAKKSLWFMTRYCAATRQRISRDKEVWNTAGASNLEELQRILRATVMVRRRKADVLKDLPPKRRQVIVLPATGGLFDRAEHARVVEQYGSALLSIGQLDPRFAVIARLRQQAARAKLPLVLEHLKDTLESTPKIVCFAYHREIVERIAKEFGRAAVLLYGGMKKETQQAAVDRFQSDSSCQLFVGSIGAAGVGWTLTAAAHVVFAELDWTPAILSQAEDRCHRIGQHDSVLVQHLVLDGSIDALIVDNLLKKQQINDALLGRS